MPERLICSTQGASCEYSWPFDPMLHDKLHFWHITVMFFYIKSLTKGRVWVSFMSKMSSVSDDVCSAAELCKLMSREALFIHIFNRAVCLIWEFIDLIGEIFVLKIAVLLTKAQAHCSSMAMINLNREVTSSHNTGVSWDHFSYNWDFMSAKYFDVWTNCSMLFLKC